MGGLQEAFNFENQTYYPIEDFIVSDANHSAYKWVISYPDNPVLMSAIAGPKGSGKTHLRCIWQDRMAAISVSHDGLENLLMQVHRCPIVIEDIDQIQDETLLFHVFNHVHMLKIPVLFTSSLSLSLVAKELKDLNSRLLSVHQEQILLPDETLLQLVLMKQFSDRQLRVDKEVVEYLLKRMERSFIAAERLVDVIDHYALRHKRAITVPLVRQCLEDNI